MSMEYGTIKHFRLIKVNDFRETVGMTVLYNTYYVILQHV